MKSNWQLVKFNDVVEFPPKVQLKKDEEYDVIEMEDINTQRRYVYSTKLRKYESSGVSKFENGDVVFARITPCLENGKIAQVRLSYKQKGFGSTELFVFRPKLNLIDSNYLYYLSKSDIIRLSAINSMTGASGRQRADKQFVQNIQFKLPSITLQRKIGEILSNHDELIENNNKRIDILEKMAQEIYKEWFLRMRFPGYEKVKFEKGIPEGWKVVKIKDIGFDFGDAPFGSDLKSSDYTARGIPVIQGRNIKNDRFEWNNKLYVSVGKFEKIKRSHCKEGDLVFPKVGTLGGCAIMPKVEGHSEVLLSTNMMKMSVKEGVAELLYVYYYFKRDDIKEYIIITAGGSSQPIFNFTTLKNFNILLPSYELQKKFSDCIEPISKQIALLSEKNINLTKTRELLLPRLMSGELSVE